MSDFVRTNLLKVSGQQTHFTKYINHLVRGCLKVKMKRVFPVFILREVKFLLRLQNVLHLGRNFLFATMLKGIDNEEWISVRCL